MTIAKAISVKALSKYKIRLKYSDNTEGEIDLSHLSGRGVFKDWDKDDLFNKVSIDSESGAIAWNSKIDLCPNTLYLKLKGISFEEWQKENTTYAAN